MIRGALPKFAAANGAKRNFGAEDAPFLRVPTRVDALADCRCHQRVSDVVQLRQRTVRPAIHAGSEFHQFSPEPSDGERRATSRADCGSGSAAIPAALPAVNGFPHSTRFRQCSPCSSATSSALRFDGFLGSQGRGARTRTTDGSVAAGSSLGRKGQSASRQTILRSNNRNRHRSPRSIRFQHSGRTADGERRNGSGAICCGLRSEGFVLQHCSNLQSGKQGVWRVREAPSRLTGSEHGRPA